MVCHTAKVEALSLLEDFECVSCNVIHTTDCKNIFVCKTNNIGYGRENVVLIKGKDRLYEIFRYGYSKTISIHSGVF